MHALSGPDPHLKQDKETIECIQILNGIQIMAQKCRGSEQYVFALHPYSNALSYLPY